MEIGTVNVAVRTVLHEQSARLDRGGLAAPLSAKIFEGRVGRTHSPADPLSYATGPEHRDLAEVENIVAQLVGIKVTLQHPQGLLRDGVEAHVIGVVTGARIDGEFAVATILITDEVALEAIDNGVVELSLGYNCHLDEQRYQRGISLDHLALVPAARCGETCALRTDCADPEVKCAPCKLRAISYAAEQAPVITEKDKTMEELQAKLDAALADVASEKLRADNAAAELATAQAKIVEIETKAKLDADNAAADLAKAAAEAETARADAAAAAALAADQTKFDAAVKARTALLASAKAVGVEEKVTAADGTSKNLDELSDRDVKAAVIKHVDGIEVAADAAPLYVDGMFAGSMRRADVATRSRAEVLETIQEQRTDGVSPTPNSQKAEEEARAASFTRRATAFRRKKTQE